VGEKKRGGERRFGLGRKEKRNRERFSILKILQTIQFKFKFNEI